ncbi:MAG TPA: histidinol-phosphate transaminase [Gaiellaceae bacterium]|nr:histidinol-phosphate transaminase [Gaiellaceae bacterium]
MPAPRQTGSGFEPYRWALPPDAVAARHGLSPAHVLRFDSNLPAFPAPLPPGVRAALSVRADYPEGTYRELREAAASYAGCGPDEIAIDAGADGLIGLVARTFLSAGRHAAVEEPTYPMYAIASQIEGAEVVATPRDLEALAEAGRDAHVLWICNPGNPSGELFSAENIASVADALPDTVVCVDEAYFEYAGETTAPHARERPNLVCVRTLSKAFGLAGLRVGYAIASRALAGELTDRRAPGPISNFAAALGADALLRPGLAEAEVNAVRAERERLRTAFLAAGWNAPESHASFVVARTLEAPALAMELERRGLVVRSYADALRISVRSPADDDLVLTALGIDPPVASRRSATVLGPGVRASLVLDGTGRVSSRTGDDDEDRQIEEHASARRWDLEVVAGADARRDVVDAALAEAEALAGAYPAASKA